MDEIELNAFDSKIKNKKENKNNKNKNMIYSNYNKKLHSKSNSNSFLKKNNFPSKKRNISYNNNNNNNSLNSFINLTTPNENFEEIIKENNSLINSLKTQNKQKIKDLKNLSKNFNNLNEDFKKKKNISENTNEKNKKFFEINTKLFYTNYKLNKMNEINSNEITNKKNLNEKMKNQINNIEKNTREILFKSKYEKKEVETKKRLCKEISINISILIENKKTITSKIIDYQTKIQQLKLLNNKFIMEKNTIGEEIKKLTKQFS